MFCSMWDRAMIARPPPLFARGKDLVAYPEGVRLAIFASSPSPFNQVSTNSSFNKKPNQLFSQHSYIWNIYLYPLCLLYSLLSVFFNWSGFVIFHVYIVVVPSLIGTISGSNSQMKLNIVQEDNLVMLAYNVMDVHFSNTYGIHN